MYAVMLQTFEGRRLWVDHWEPVTRIVTWTSEPTKEAAEQTLREMRIDLNPGQINHGWVAPWDHRYDLQYMVTGAL